MTIMADFAKGINNITTWKKFDRQVRLKGCELLKRLDDFQDSVLITGCQRSGTTALSRMITNSTGMTNYWFGSDDELAAALILAERVVHQPQPGRYCFQTTYLNANYHEYFLHTNNGYKIIWVLRNPFSVVYSMLHHWRRAALGRLFRACGAHLLQGTAQHRYNRYGLWGVPRLQQACLSYIGKLTQIFELKDRLSPDRMKIVSYDDLVKNKEELLPEIYGFIDLEYKERYGDMLHCGSITKATRQPAREATAVEAQCVPVYRAALRLI